MSNITATSSITIAAPPETVFTALCDYRTVRPEILGPSYKDYQLISGGIGEGTVVEWTLQATQKRSRDVVSHITVNDNTITEKDANSTLTTTYTVVPLPQGCQVSTTTSWKGGTGIKGFFERTFAPKGVRGFQHIILHNLKQKLESGG